MKMLGRAQKKVIFCYDIKQAGKLLKLTHSKLHDNPNRKMLQNTGFLIVLLMKTTLFGPSQLRHKCDSILTKYLSCLRPISPDHLAMNKDGRFSSKY